ncbi:MAG: hypothetical protein K940chlam9_02031 [Chlamydiae bacterium]|nr:hypothetical protein [Chlamydiota bacterium]
MPRQSRSSHACLKPAFKSVGSSCCPHRCPFRENGRHIFAKHDLETAQKICRSLGETEIKESLLISPITKFSLSKTRTLFFFEVFPLRE